jgi:uncharacterized membrane protein YjjP (DUF1212 family)
MALQGRAEVVLSFAPILHVNGQSTEETVAAAERLGNTLGLRAGIFPRWGKLQLQPRDGDKGFVSLRAADPTGINMDRVVSAMRTTGDFDAGRLTPSALRAAFTMISQTPPAPTWLFALAAAAGAAAMAVLFGVQHLAAGALTSSVRRAALFYVAQLVDIVRTYCCSRSARRCSLGSLARSRCATSSAPRSASWPSALA